MKYMPGTQEDGKLNSEELKMWVSEVRSLCATYGRQEMGDQKIGQLLASATAGEDSLWPCIQVRQVLEAIPSPEIARGFELAVYNARGVHFRGEDGEQERLLADRYQKWATQLAFEYPITSKILANIAARYQSEAVSEDSRAAVRRRLVR
ncbi:MAG: hypothetical protein JO033_08315 [Acidobacteriaceae bacterium]|nr:hypothetical protein [Acidobacteriaceae bacterium]